MLSVLLSALSLTCLYLACGVLVGLFMWFVFFAPSPFSASKPRTLAGVMASVVQVMAVNEQKAFMADLEDADADLHREVSRQLEELARVEGEYYRDLYDKLLDEDVMECVVFGLLWPLTLVMLLCVVVLYACTCMTTLLTHSLAYVSERVIRKIKG